VSAITWKTMDIPSFRDSMQAMPAVGVSFNRASDDLKGMLTDYNTRQDANWNQGRKNNTNTLLAESQQANDLNSFYSSDPSYSIQGMKDRFGVQVNQDDVLAGRLKQEALLNTKAQDAASIIGRDTFSTTADPLATNIAMRDSFTANGVKPINQSKMIGDINTANKDENEVLTKNVINTHNQELLGQLSLSNLQDVLKSGREKYKTLFDPAAVIAQHKSMEDTAKEATLAAASKVVADNRNPSSGYDYIRNSDMPSALKVATAKSLTELVSLNATPSEVDKAALAERALVDKIDISDRLVAGKTQLATKQKAAEAYKTSSEIEKAAAATIAANGSVGDVAKDVVDQTIVGQVLGMIGDVKGGADATTQLHKQKQAIATMADKNGNRYFSDSEADQIIKFSIQNSDSKKTPWHQFFGDGKGLAITPFAKAAQEEAANMIKYKQLKGEITQLETAITSDQTNAENNAALDNARYLREDAGARASGNSARDISSFHSPAAPGVLLTERLLGKVPAVKPSAKTPGENAATLKQTASSVPQGLYSKDPNITDALNVTHTIETKNGTVPDRKGSQYVGPLQLGKAARAEAGLTEEEAKDPEKAFAATAKKFEQINTKLSSVGIEGSPANIYMAHQQGVTGFLEIADAVRTGANVSDVRQANMDNNRPWVNGSKLPKGASPEEWLNGWTQVANSKSNLHTQGQTVLNQDATNKADTASYRAALVGDSSRYSTPGSDPSALVSSAGLHDISEVAKSATAAVQGDLAKPFRPLNPIGIEHNTPLWLTQKAKSVMGDTPEARLIAKGEAGLPDYANEITQANAAKLQAENTKAIQQSSHADALDTKNDYNQDIAGSADLVRKAKEAFSQDNPRKLGGNNQADNRERTATLDAYAAVENALTTKEYTSKGEADYQKSPEELLKAAVTTLADENTSAADKAGLRLQAKILRSIIANSKGRG